MPKLATRTERIVVVRRLIGPDGVTHATDNDVIDTAVVQVTACGIPFRIHLLRGRFHVVGPTRGALYETDEERPVDCMTCLTRINNLFVEKPT